MSEEMESTTSLEETLLSKFECPVCFKYMNLPIRLCLSGHSYCEYCFEKIKKCALCRANKSPYRCIILEQIHSMLTFPCKYADLGCPFTGKGDLMTSHQEYCEYSSVTCPLRFNSCQWSGTRAQMMLHCNDVHSDNTFFVSRQKLKVTNFSELINRNYYIILNVFDNMFRCSWDVRQETGIMRFAVYYLGKPVSDKEFSFKISILLGDTSTEVVSLSGPCYHMKDDNIRFIEHRHLSANHSMIKDFCDSNGDFNYVINIIKNVSEDSEMDD